VEKGIGGRQIEGNKRGNKQIIEKQIKLKKV
jgi:hypothetical protein